MMGRKMMTAAVVATIIMGGAFVATRYASSSPGQLLQPDDPEIVAAGHRIYEVHCASCHGANLEGEPDWQTRDADGFLPAPPHDETGHTWHHPDQGLFDITRNGIQAYAGKDYRTRMPAFGTILPDSAIIAALSYIKSRWPNAVREGHDSMNAARAEDGSG